MEILDIEIKVVQDDVLFISTREDEEIYNIGKIELPQVIDEKYSKWILHLMHKTWVSAKVLYQLAVIIQKEYPDNKIDWKSTFFVVEKKNYLESTGAVLLEKRESGGSSLLDRIKFNQKESTKELHDEIDKIVAEMLKEYNL